MTRNAQVPSIEINPSQVHDLCDLVQNSQGGTEPVDINSLNNEQASFVASIIELLPDEGGKIEVTCNGGDISAVIRVVTSEFERKLLKYISGQCMRDSKGSMKDQLWSVA